MSAFSLPETYWPMNSKVTVGDVVYIYLASPYKQIAFISEISETDLNEDSIIKHIRPFMKETIVHKKASKTFMKLKKKSNVALEKNTLLGYHYLKENGLNGMLMGPRKLENNPELLTYIKNALP